jgi:putative flippase GtrA
MFADCVILVRVMKRTDFRPTRSNVVQFLEYLVGGTIYFWSGYAVFAIFYSGYAWSWLPAKIFADIVGWTLSYVVQRYWAFSAKDLRHHEGSTVGRYATITLVNLAIDYTLIWSLKIAGVSPYIGFFISAGFFTIWNYLWYRFWVFFTKRNTGVVNG